LTLTFKSGGISRLYPYGAANFPGSKSIQPRDRVRNAFVHGVLKGVRRDGVNPGDIRCFDATYGRSYGKGRMLLFDKVILGIRGEDSDL
jgi:hypothetical protein